MTDLLASIDDVLEAVEAAPAPAADPASVPVPDSPDAAVEAPVEAPVERGDWWESLYGAPEAEAADAAAGAAPASEGRVSRAPRLPYWWERPKQPETPEVPEPEQPEPEAPGRAGAATGACAHARLLALRAEGGHGEVVARLCLDCDGRLPATDPEPEAECEHEERLEARSERGKLIGYVCAAKGCGARLTVDEVQGRIGKWLRPAEGYYARFRKPFSPAVGADGEEAKPALSPGTRRLLANAGAAGAGYGLGLVPMLGSWIEECARTTSIGGGLILGGSICLALGHFWDRRTRHWNPGLAWAARIPLASAVTALALYAPASQI
ncbi:hypothetical protein ACIOJ9_39220 [Streptomyces sp. NPDC088175]|uniref:hypothetical protein n=1 Tax=unclassified Streptomyces TaxID=2593676 RepID=UPI00381EB529